MTAEGVSMIKRVLAGLAEDADDDWVFITDVRDRVRSELLSGGYSLELWRSVVDAVLAHMVVSGTFVAGDCHSVIRCKEGPDAPLPPRSQWFNVWNGSPLDWLRRIYAELDAWEDLDQLLSFDVVTFIPTSSDLAKP